MFNQNTPIQMTLCWSNSVLPRGKQVGFLFHLWIQVYYKIIKQYTKLYNISFVIFKRTMLFPDYISTPNADQNIPSKRIRTLNPKYFTPLSCVTNTSKFSSGQSSTNVKQHPLGTGYIYESLLIFTTFQVLFSIDY
jgi:hypothetical protein